MTDHMWEIMETVGIGIMLQEAAVIQAAAVLAVGALDRNHVTKTSKDMRARWKEYYGFLKEDLEELNKEKT